MSTSTSTVRRFALTLGVAGIAALGSVAVAPAAFAAPSTSASVVADPADNNGPDMFLSRWHENGEQHGKLPVFLCEDKADKADKNDKKADEKADKKADEKADKDDPKQHNNCIEITTHERF
jgi:hypothetical protein